MHVDDEPDRMPEDYQISKEYVKAFVKSLDKNFKDRPTEFNVLIRCDFYDEEKKLYQITKKPFESSVLKKLKWSKCNEPHNCL